MQIEYTIRFPEVFQEVQKLLQENQVKPIDKDRYHWIRVDAYRLEIRRPFTGAVCETWQTSKNSKESEERIQKAVNLYNRGFINPKDL